MPTLRRIPDIEINGKPEEDFVNNNIMGPEDEDDGDNHPLPERDTADVGEKTKRKKKPKSKRGLVRCCLYDLPS